MLRTPHSAVRQCLLTCMPLLLACKRALAFPLCTSIFHLRCSLGAMFGCIDWSVELDVTELKLCEAHFWLGGRTPDNGGLSSGGCCRGLLDGRRGRYNLEALMGLTCTSICGLYGQGCNDQGIERRAVRAQPSQSRGWLWQAALTAARCMIVGWCWRWKGRWGHGQRS